LNDRKRKLIEIAETLKISKERVGHIVHEYLNMKNLCAKWLPRVLTIDQYQQRIDDSEQCLAIFDPNKDKFSVDILQKDETWLLHYSPEYNRETTMCTECNEPNPKRLKTQRSAVSWQGYLEKGQTINSEYNIALLERLTDEIKKNGPNEEEKSAVSTRQCILSQINKNDGKIA
jgi:hypothetical protein